MCGYSWTTDYGADVIRFVSLNKRCVIVSVFVARGWGGVRAGG
jgi:hypothetical protein